MAPKKPKPKPTIKVATPWIPSNSQTQKELDKAIKGAYKIGKNPYQKQNDALQKEIERRMRGNR